ncbi:hypothetical protein VV208B2_11090 [Vibrio vulnificus]|nr:hypothetical protein VV208B2_11090 [Vibrio vulnificus]
MLSEWHERHFDQALYCRRCGTDHAEVASERISNSGMRNKGKGSKGKREKDEKIVRKKKRDGVPSLFFALFEIALSNKAIQNKRATSR